MGERTVPNTQRPVINSGVSLCGFRHLSTVIVLRLYRCFNHTLFTTVMWGVGVEGLYCKRPIKCLASSEILTPHPPSPPGECALCTLPPLVRREDTLARGRGGGGVNGGSEDARHCSVLYICKYFVEKTIQMF